MKKIKWTACYLRLSKEDNNSKKTSTSIEEQKKLITKYCVDNNIFNYKFYIDDGVSGISFNRPSFNKLKEDIENKEIECVITKDLSRLGRDYIGVGYYTEVYFPNNRVRYIAINDNYDSKYGNTTAIELAPFLNLLNDQYAKDMSNKIRSVMEVRALKGEHLTGKAPYGYKKSKENKNRLEINEEVEYVIKFIFEKYLEGYGSIKIRNMLKEKKILTPSGYDIKNGGTQHSRHFEKDEDLYKWTSIMVLRILKNKLYIGTKVYYKKRKKTHKSRRLVQDKDKWIEVKNAHPKIIDDEMFNTVQEKLSVYKSYKDNKTDNIFKGLVKCGCCGWNMNLYERKIKNTKGELVRSVKYLKCGRKTIYGEGSCEGTTIACDELKRVVIASLKKLSY